MSTITNVALNFTKEELIARLRAVLPIAKERDKKAVAEHRAAERAYLDGWRDRLRECLKWGYKTAKESYFNIGGDFGRWGAPSCPEPLVEKIESAIAMVEMSNQSKYTLNHDGRNQNLYRLVTLDAARAAGVTYRQVDHWLRNGLNVGTNPRPGRGSARSGSSTTPVLDAFISSGQALSFFGIPPAAPVRVRDWFLGVPDQDLDDRLFPAEVVLDRGKAVQQAAWAVREDLPPSPDFVSWYRSMDQASQESVESDVLRAFEADRKRPSAARGGVERLDGRAPAWLGGAQRVCSRYLASQVKYVGPLRQAPHQPFGSAPDPDSGDVGVAGQYVAAVMQANRSLKRRFPLPPDPSTGREDAATSLEDAVNRWLAFLDLATSLAIREDTPLVLGIDVVPPGLGKAVPLGSVGVGVSQVLPIIVQCLVAGPGALVVLEQPELHLHPAAQQRLADFLLACTAWGQNIIVESHSEYLVLRLRRRIAEDLSDALRSQVSILFAERDSTGATRYRDVELTPTGGVVEWPAGFFDQGPDEAHQLLIAAAERQRSRKV